MTPAQPPLPTAWNLPFHPLAGSHTSTLMSESLLGVSVIATRQNAGRSVNEAPRVPWAPSATGSENAPAATRCAVVTVASFNVSRARLSHGAANAASGARHADIETAHAIARRIIEIGLRRRGGHGRAPQPSAPQ